MVVPAQKRRFKSAHSRISQSVHPMVEGLKAAGEIAKQLITLSVAMIGLTVTFLKEIVDPIVQAGPRTIPWQMKVAWGGYMLCILGAIATLMGISGTLTYLDRKAMGLPPHPAHSPVTDIYDLNVRLPMLLMALAFLVGIGFTIVTAAR